MALSDVEVKAAKATGATYRLADGGSLFLKVSPAGSRSWEFRWKSGGVVRAAILGNYDDGMGLRAARAARDTMREAIRKGHDPIAQRRTARDDTALAEARAREERARELAEVRAREDAERRARVTFADVTDKWVAARSAGWVESHRGRLERSIELHVAEALGDKPVADIDAPMILAALDPLIAAGKVETAARVFGRIGKILAFAALNKLGASTAYHDAKDEFVERVKGARRQKPAGKMAALDADDVPGFFAALAKYPGHPTVANFVAFTILCAARPGESRLATWEEIDGDVWNVPAERMKMRRPHRVPLSRQALVILAAQRRITKGAPGFIFPTPRHPERALSENAGIAALAALGYATTLHGTARASFSTWANERHRARPDVVEACLAHVVEGVRGAYMRGTFDDERRDLLQAWADFASPVRVALVATA